MMTLKCKDLGGNDEFIAKGEKTDEVKELMMKHMQEHHQDMMDSMPIEEKKDLDIKMEALIVNEKTS
ncbi:MAG: DUF1059 domain-containing protein [Nanoarchaeota archaeon]|nr:DUF1059 domain-containing protein [Nanoarchaeota archaeon]